MFVFPSTLLRIWFGSWNRLLARHLTSRVASLLQSEGGVVVDVHVESGHSVSVFGESSDFS